MSVTEPLLQRCMHCRWSPAPPRRMTKESMTEQFGLTEVQATLVAREVVHVEPDS